MNEFRICPACGYGRGFHLFLRGDEEGRGLHVGLICPDCGHSYDPGWVVQLAPGDPARGPVFPSHEGGVNG